VNELFLSGTSADISLFSTLRLCVQSRHAQDPSPQFIRNYFSAFANDPILTNVHGIEKLEAGTPDGDGDEKEKMEEMEKDAFVIRYRWIFYVHYLHSLQFTVHCSCA